VISADGTAGGNVPYFKIPRVGVKVRSPEDGGCVVAAADVGFSVPLVAVAGVVVRLGMGVVGRVTVMSVGTDVAVGDAVRVSGTSVGEG
jgi:hypothetical protein